MTGRSAFSAMYTLSFLGLCSCGVPEGRYYEVIHDKICDLEAICHPLLEKEDCLKIAPEHVGKVCTYDSSVAGECRLALEEADCTVDEVTGQSWFETPDVCLSVWSCD